MQTECSAEQLEFSCVGRRRVVAAFDGGTVSSDAGGLLLGRADEAIGLIDRLAECFTDHRDPDLIEHTVRTLIGQRVFGLALGYEDLNDHEQLRHDPVFGALLGKLEAKRRSSCAGAGGKEQHSIAWSCMRWKGWIGITRFVLEPRRSNAYGWSCFWKHTGRRLSRSCWIWMRPMIRCMAIRKAASFTGTTITTATCRCTSFAASTCWCRAAPRQH